MFASAEDHSTVAITSALKSFGRGRAITLVYAGGGDGGRGEGGRRESDEGGHVPRRRGRGRGGVGIWGNIFSEEGGGEFAVGGRRGTRRRRRRRRASH